MREKTAPLLRGSAVKTGAPVDFRFPQNRRDIIRQGRGMREARNPSDTELPRQNGLIPDLFSRFFLQQGKKPKPGCTPRSEGLTAKLHIMLSVRKENLLIGVFLTPPLWEGAGGRLLKFFNNEKANFIFSDVYNGVNFRRY